MRHPYPGLLADGTMPAAPGMSECPDCGEILPTGRRYNFHIGTKHGKGPLAFSCNPILAGRKGAAKSGESRRRKAEERRVEAHTHPLTCPNCDYGWREHLPPRRIPLKRKGGLPTRDPVTKQFVKTATT